MEDVATKESKASSTYLVFPCIECGKYTYAKKSQKARKCGICGKNMIIGAIKNGSPACNVNDAAKQANLKNTGWLATKGIHLDCAQSKTISLPKNAVSISSKPTEAPNPFQISLANIQTAMKADGIIDLKQIPVAYLKILYDTHGIAPKNFDQFYAFFNHTYKFK